MADRASHATKPSESDFHDSHPLDEDVSPSLGDLSGLDALSDISDVDSQHVGDMASVNPEEDDVLGDITLLEEAFAEMEDSSGSEEQVDESQTSAPASESIPILNEAVDEPTADTESKAAMEEIDQSIPVLEQEATAFAKSAKVTAFESVVEEESSDAGDSALEHLLIEDDEPNIDPALDDAMADASVFVEPDDGSASSMSQFDQAATSFAEIDADTGNNTAVDTLSDSDIADISDSDVAQESVDDKIAKMTGDQTQIEINEVPFSQPLSSITAAASVSDLTDPYSGVPSDFAASRSSMPSVSVPSRFEDSQSVSQATHAEHKVSVGEKNGFSINIPFELHAQLSKKIDALVIDATTSLTHELHGHLSDRLEILLAQAVEAVLPSLVDQMVNGLRIEVKHRVKEQLPVIINEVLGKTSLKDK